MSPAGRASSIRLARPGELPDGRFDRADTVISSPCRAGRVCAACSRGSSATGGAGGDLPEGCDEGLAWSSCAGSGVFPKNNRPRILELLDGLDGRVAVSPPALADGGRAATRHALAVVAPPGAS
jgi:hypothetical protein